MLANSGKHQGTVAWDPRAVKVFITAWEAGTYQLSEKEVSQYALLATAARNAFARKAMEISAPKAEEIHREDAEAPLPLRSLK